jgi:hypothetical protein
MDTIFFERNDTIFSITGKELKTGTISIRNYELEITN